MNIEFTAFEYESDYVMKAYEHVNRMLEKGLAKKDESYVYYFHYVMYDIEF